MNTMYKGYDGQHQNVYHAVAPPTKRNTVIFPNTETGCQEYLEWLLNLSILFFFSFMIVLKYVGGQDLCFYKDIKQKSACFL